MQPLRRGLSRAKLLALRDLAEFERRPYGTEASWLWQTSNK